MDTFGYRSRYRTTPAMLFDGVETMGVWGQPSYLRQRPSQNLIRKYYVTSAVEGRPDLIANSVYGSPELGWVVIAFNRPSEILNWPRAGDVIEIVDRQLVYGEL